MKNIETKETIFAVAKATLEAHYSFTNNVEDDDFVVDVNLENIQEPGF